MLTALREGVKSGFTKFILLGFMALAVGGLVMTDVGGFFRGGSISSNHVASFSGNKLTANQFDMTVRRVLNQQNLDTTSAYQLGFIDQILFREINGSLLAKDAMDLGLAVSDNIVAQQIKDIVNPHVTDDVTPEQVLNHLLRAQNMSEKQMVGTIKNEMTSTMIRNAIASNAKLISSQEASTLYQFRNEERDLDLLIFPNNTVSDFEQPSDEDLEAFYQTQKQKFLVPEMRSFSYVMLTEENLSDKIEITEDEIREIYEQDLDIYTIPEKRKLEQAIFEDEASASAVLTALTNTNNNLEKAIAAENSNGQFVGTKEFEEKALIKELAQPVFAATKGDVLGPIQTPLGYHVVIIKNIIAGKQQEFSEVKENIKEMILFDRLGTELFALSGEMDDAFAGGETIENVAASFDLEIKSTTSMRVDGSTDDSKDAMKDFKHEDVSEILEMVFEIEEGEISPVFELSEGAFMAVKVDTLTPSGFKPLKEVKEQIKKDWIEKEKALSNAQKVSGYLAALEDEETDLKSIAKENELKIKAKKLTRFGIVPEELTSGAKDKIFVAQQGQFILSTVPEGFMLAKLKSIKIPDADKITEEQLANMDELLVDAYNSEFVQLYLNHLFKDNKVKVNRDLIKQMYGSEEQL